MDEWSKSLFSRTVQQTNRVNDTSAVSDALS